MEIREYETTFIIAPNLSEEETNGVIEKFKDVVEKNGGKELDVEIMGKRKLAYEIKKFDEGVYVIFRYKTEGGTGLVAELERRMRNDENILRFLTVRMDLELKKPRKLEEKWKKKREKLEALKKQKEDETEEGGVS